MRSDKYNETTKQTKPLENIIEAFDKLPVPEARLLLTDRIGARLSIKGVIEKVIKRDGLKPYVKSDEQTFMIFADFTGNFRTVGYCAATDG